MIVRERFTCTEKSELWTPGSGKNIHTIKLYSTHKTDDDRSTGDNTIRPEVAVTFVLGEDYYVEIKKQETKP